MSGSFVNLLSEDTHCRPDGVYFQADRVQVILRALEAGVTRWVNPVLSFVNLADGLALAVRYFGCYLSVGIYLRYCPDWQPGDIKRIRQAAGKKVIALGVRSVFNL